MITHLYMYTCIIYIIYMYVQIHVKKSVHYIALHLLTLDFVICNVIYIYIYMMSEQKHCIIILKYCQNQISGW